MPMVRKANEVHHNAEEQVTDYARRAVAVADALDLSPEDRAVLLPTIMMQLGSKQVFIETMDVGPAMAIPRGRG